MDNNRPSPNDQDRLGNHPGLRRLAWAPIPVLLLAITCLWIADLRTVYESRALMVLLNLVFTWLASLCICVLTARGFLGSGQPGLLMFGCGSLLWGVTSLAAAMVVDRVNPTITVHNLGVLGAASCHLIGLLWRGRLPRPGQWLVMGYAAALVTAALIVWAGLAGLLPVFFVQGQGGVLVRQVVLLLAVAMFAWVAWQLIRRFRRQAGAFYYWYGLGLALVATGLTGVLLLSVQGGILGWTNRLTQYLGSAYLFVAAFMAARETGRWTFSLAPAEEVWRESGFLAGFRQQTPLGWVLRYGLAVGAVAAAMGLLQALTVGFGPGLPPYITFYPVVMAVALLGGFGPGLVATVFGGLLAAYWILPPVGEFGIASPVDRLGLVIFAGMGLFMSVVADLYRRYRKKAAAYDREAAVRASEGFRQAILDSLPAHVAVLDGRGIVSAVNESWLRFARENGPQDQANVSVGADYLGVCRQAKEAADPLAKEALEGITAVLARERSEFTLEYSCHSPTQQRWFLMSVVRPIGGVRGAVIMHLDITERKRAEAALRESRERLDLALASSRMATFDWDIVKDKRTWSQGVHSLLGTKPETFTGSPDEFYRVLHPDDQANVRAALARAVETTGVYEAEYRAVWPDGSIHHIAARGRVHRDNKGRAVVMTGVCWDITEHKRVEDELRRRAEELRAANEELTRFNRVTVGRELRIIELKQQVNELCARLGQPPRYGTEYDKEVPATDETRIKHG